MDATNEPASSRAYDIFEKVIKILGVIGLLFVAALIGFICHTVSSQGNVVSKQANLLYTASMRHDLKAINELANDRVAYWFAAQDHFMGPIKEFHLGKTHVQVTGLPADVEVTVRRAKGEQGEYVGIDGAGRIEYAGLIDQSHGAPCPNDFQCDWPDP